MNNVIQASLPANTPYLKRVLTQDPYEHARNLNGWRLAYDQLSPGLFNGELIEFQSGDLQLIRDRSNQAMKKAGAAIEGSIALCVDLSRQGEVYCSGHAIDKPCLLVAPSDDIPELRVPQIVDILLASIPKNTFKHILECQGINLKDTNFPMCYQIEGSPALHELKFLIDQLSSGNLNSTLQHETIRRDIGDTVILHLLDLMTSDAPQSLKPTARKRTVDRACEYAMNHLHDPFSILELCNSIGASRRKLQYCFQESLGINPVAYLRSLRLNSVRRELQECTSTPPIQDVAARWGFWHMGRFSTDYRTLFGEKPTQTRHR